jgi:hypothetical protein
MINSKEKVPSSLDSFDKNPQQPFNTFVWWMGIVENRVDPMFLGRCQVRIYGFHPKDTVQVPTKSLPWAHPVNPLGENTTNPPLEGTLVFVFFADGHQHNVPIMLGTVPHIPDFTPDEGQGFRDPFTQAVKETRPYPRKLQSSEVSTDGKPPTYTSDTPKTNPGKVLNEPTTSRLARPNRIESDVTAESIGIRSESITGTAIDFQRRNRVKYIKTAKETSQPTGEGRVQEVWSEPFPSYNAKFPFNHVQETESGHAFEMDDTKDYERVQLSHRTGSTLEFMPSGSIKEKSFNHKYDVVMGNHKEYVLGDKITTTQGGMFLRINGKLVIQADGIDFESSGDINMKGSNVKITSRGNMDLCSFGTAKIYGVQGLGIRAEGVLSSYGARGAVHSSGGLTTISGVYDGMSDIIRKALEGVLPKDKVDAIAGSGSQSTATSGVKLLGPQIWTDGAVGYMNYALTQIAPPVVPEADAVAQLEGAANYKGPNPIMKPVVSKNAKEKTDGMGALERNFLTTVDASTTQRSTNSIKVAEDFEKTLQTAADNADLTTLKSDIPQLTEGS